MKAQQETPQISEWTGRFGREYTDRNPQDTSSLDALCLRNYGITRTALNQRFLQTVSPSARVLEVGCNLGNQLVLLRELGYAHLHGIEIQSYALEKARMQLPDAVFKEASAFAIPFPDEYFDLVFTSGVLIHIAPADLPRALDEIHRVAKTWIWGLEYYAPASTEIRYRGHNGLLWKNDFSQVYLRRFADLELIREERLRYLDKENSDAMFLLRRAV